MSAATGSDGGSGGSWSKWQIATAAVGIGVVTAATVGSLWWLSSRKKRKEANADGLSQPAVTNHSSAVSNHASSSPAAPSEAAPKEMSPVEKAREAKTRGNALFKQKEYRGAIQCYKEALDLCPPDETEDVAVFHHNIAAAYENMVAASTDSNEKIMLWENVCSHCTEALRCKPRYIKALVRRAHANEALAKKRDALLDITRLVILDDQQIKVFAESTQNLLKDISKELAEENFSTLGPLEPPTQLVRAYLNSFIWKDDLSQDRLKNLWKSHKGEDEDGFDDEPFVQAAYLFRSGKYSSSLIDKLTESIEKGLEVYKPHALLLRGCMYSLWRQEELAVKDLKSLVAIDGLAAEVYADAHIKLAAIEAGLCHMEQCYAEFDEALRQKPDHVDVFLQRSRVAMESDDPNVIMKARDDLEVVLKLAPSFPYTLYCMGSICHRSGLLSRSVHFFEEARVKFEEAYRQYPNCIEGIILYSLFLQDIEDVSKSEELLQKAIRLEPDNPSAHFSLSILYLIAHRDIERAMNSLKTAIQLDNSCIQAYETLASLEMQQGNREKALELYDSAITFSRSILEMQQAYLAREVFTTQNQVCKEYGIDPVELMASRMMGAAPGVPEQ